MENGILPDFLIIDDDPVNNKICDRIIQRTIDGSAVKTFTDPSQGLQHILANYENTNATRAILFLDINMPSMTGWDVLAKFDGFTSTVKEKVKIFMLSSSVDPQDIERATGNPLVTGYVSKSLSKDKLQDAFANYVRRN
jgi:CheY-like chemotaxis protein